MNAALPRDLVDLFNAMNPAAAARPAMPLPVAQAAHRALPILAALGVMAAHRVERH